MPARWNENARGNSHSGANAAQIAGRPNPPTADLNRSVAIVIELNKFITRAAWSTRAELAYDDR